MRALVVSGPGDARVEHVAPPEASPGQVVVDVERVGICGTDVEFFTGEMAYLHQGLAEYPMRLGHEWVGRVSALGRGVEPSWLGARVTADTMLGCGRCERCLTGRSHLCARRHEIGIRGGWPGALAEQLPVPESALHEIPESMTAESAALIEPGANAVRVLVAAGDVAGRRVLVFGPGTIGLLVAQFAMADGAEVHVVGIEETSLDMARYFGVEHVGLLGDLQGQFDIVIDATNDPTVPAATLQWVEPGGQVVLIGLSGDPSLVDSREVVIGDLRVTGVLSGWGGIPEAIKAYTSGAVMPDALVAEVVTFEEVAGRLRGERGAEAGAGPKVQVDPRAV